jgi:hypothetical protein
VDENKEDVIQYLDLESARRPGLEDSKRINIDLPSDFLAELDKEAAHRGITRQSLIKVWLEPSLTLASRPIAKSDVPGNVIVKTGNAPYRRRIDWNKSGIAYEMTRADVKDHDAFELQITVAAPSIASRGLRMVQFRGKAMDIPRENFWGLYSEIKRAISKSRGVLRPIFMGALLGQLDFIWSRITSVDGEIAVVDFLGTKLRERSEKKSKKKNSGTAHKSYTFPWNDSRCRNWFKIDPLATPEQKRDRSDKSEKWKTRLEWGDRGCKASSSEAGEGLY